MSCPNCAAPKTPGARYCPQCGVRLTLATDGLKAGDRRVVSALFADLVGYTRLVDELDPEEVRIRVDVALSVLSGAVDKLGGTVEKFIGDAVLVLFGTPAAHDDDAVRACLCALEMQKVLSWSTTGDDRPLQLRIGVATGEVVAAQRDLAGTRSVALTGDPLTTAARLQQLAEPGEILIDSATATAAETRIGYVQVGERLLRGQARPVLVSRLRGERRIVRHPGAGATPLVGRDDEKALLAGMLARAATTGRGGTVLVRGEAGIGKSRLLAEMEDDARAAGFGWTWIDHPPHRMGQPYGTARALVDALSDEVGVRAGVLARQVVGSDMDEETARLLFGAAAIIAKDSDMQLLPEEGWDERFTGLSDPTELVTGVKLVVRWFMSGLIATQPRCVVMDDYHWMDPSSQMMLGEMVRLSGELPLVVLTGTRPPLMPDWVALPQVQVLELVGLDEAATEQLGTAVAGASLDAESARWLHERTAGNALFVGEVVRTLRDGGRLESVEGGVRIDRGQARRSVPLSLKALVGARIDSLPEPQRLALEVASVIGTTFSEELLQELCDDCESGNYLELLADGGILSRVDPAGEDGSASQAATAPLWRFRHALFLDAAYGRLLGDRRRALHGALADLLQAQEAHTDTGELARHRVAAGDAARALPLLEMAAREAAAMGAMTESETFLRTAARLRGEAGPGPAVSQAVP